MAERTRFEFHEFYYEVAKCLPDNLRLQLYDFIIRYALYGEDYEGDDPQIKGIALMMKYHLNRDLHFSEKQNGRRTQEYKEWRDTVFIRDDYTCQCCGQKGGTLNAHHIRPYSKYPALRYDIDNGITLCVKCHRNMHRGMRKDEE